MKQRVNQLLQWLALILLISFTSGTSSALFLVSLDWVGKFRDAHFYLIYFLPIGGILIALIYKNWGTEISKGNNLIIEEIHYPNKIIPWIMNPIIFITTLLTHIFGGSAGREGTAVQMSTSINDQFSNLFKFDKINRKTILLASVAAGFSSVFGTPLAGLVFAIEFSWLGSISILAIIPILLASYGADFVTQHVWNVGHTHYFIKQIPSLNISNLGLTILIGLIFGLVALSYSTFSHLIINQGKKWIENPIWRIVAGSFILIAIFSILHFVFNNDKYLGLGVNVIVDSFSKPSNTYDFAFKILLTTFTLGIGFKGGEVTPLFFIGATLGSALSLFIPLPISFLAAMGFVAVFSGCARTPIACTIMGFELFGIESIIYIAMVCWIAFFIAKKQGIYTAQLAHPLFKYSYNQ